jgi:hypothetical protein
VERLDRLVDRAGRQRLQGATALVSDRLVFVDGCLALLGLPDLVAAVVVDGFDGDVA